MAGLARRPGATVGMGAAFDLQDSIRPRRAPNRPETVIYRAGLGGCVCCGLQERPAARIRAMGRFTAYAWLQVQPAVAHSGRRGIGRLNPGDFVSLSRCAAIQGEPEGRHTMIGGNIAAAVDPRLEPCQLCNRLTQTPRRASRARDGQLRLTQRMLVVASGWRAAFVDRQHHGPRECLKTRR